MLNIFKIDISKHVLLTIALTLSFLGQAGAQAQRALPASSAPPALSAAPYLLGTDDVLSIQVLNFPELCVPQITVPSDGRITVPVLNSVSVAGHTTAYVAKMLTDRWSKFYVSPFVTVTLTQRRHQSVQIYGFVIHPQAVEYQPGLHLMEALATAGGAAQNGDLAHVAVTHKSGATQTANLSSPQTAGGTTQDIVLLPEDVIFVPERHLQISILGEVVKPGSYDYQDKMTVLDALKDADNINVATADLTNATLRHNGTDSPLNLDALLKGGQTADNFALAPGDSIFIPVLHNRIFVDGAVRNGGYYAFKPGDRLVNAISGSGGTIAGVSDLAKVTVVHQDKKNNTYIAQTVDFGKFLQHGDTSVNLPLQPDDAIYIPVKGTNTNALAVLGSLVGIGSGARVLSGR